jgi:dTDP-4-dehydrorhamnose 3,5-epimerase
VIAHETALPGVLVLEDEVFRDERGSITVAWMAEALQAHGLVATAAQCNLVHNHRRGTLRGLHYQRAPLAEVKIVRAIRGRIFDVAVDLRPESPTYCQWTSVELEEGGPRMFYLPVGIAHGYQTLTDDADVLYVVSAKYSAAHQMGIRWDDPAFGVQWPIAPPTVIHPRDAGYADFAAAPRAAHPRR